MYCRSAPQTGFGTQLRAQRSDELAQPLHSQAPWHLLPVLSQAVCFLNTCSRATAEHSSSCFPGLVAGTVSKSPKDRSWVRKKWERCSTMLHCFPLPELWEACPLLVDRGVTTRGVKGRVSLVPQPGFSLFPISFLSCVLSPRVSLWSLLPTPPTISLLTTLARRVSLAVLLYTFSLITLFLNFNQQTYLRGNGRS